jgi:DivIVA domain-containing protein
MTDDRRVVITSEPHLTPEEVARRTFGTVFRGFDPNEVKSYLRRVSEELGVARERQRHVEHLLAEAQGRAQAPPPPLDEAGLMAALGEETARVLRTAREAAADMKAKAEENIERLLHQAHEDAARIRGEAEGVMALRSQEAAEVADQIRAEAEAEAEAMRARATDDVESIVEGARQQALVMIGEAKAARAKMLADIVRRRNVARIQVAQLRAGRERLLEAYRIVRGTLDEVTDNLGRAEDEARAAAEEAGQRMAAEAGMELAVAETAEAVDAAAAALEAELLGEPVAVDLAADVIDLALPVHDEVPDTSEAPLAPEPEPETAAAPDAPAPEPVTEPDQLPSAPLDIVEPPEDIEAVRIIVPVAGETDPEPEAHTDAEPAPEPEPEPVAEPVAEPEPVAEAEAPVVGEPAVDDLFARIRAGRAEAVASAQKVLAETAAPEAANGNGNGNGNTPAVTADEPAGPTDDDLVGQRDAQLEPILAQLAKRLKRAMQDEQNDVLDRLRVHKGRPSLTDVLPDAAEQGRRYRDIAGPLLEQAARAGAGFAGEPGAAVELADVVEGLADAVTGPLRTRLDEAFTAAAREDDDQAATTERVGAAYREWKMQRIERLAGDQAVAAFARGAFAATPEGTTLRWVAHDLDGLCPDCDDNALAGATPRGEAFPTGQLHPPAHGGCRCLLIPSA